MKKTLSLIKACMTDNMSLFRIKTKGKNEVSKKILPVFIAICVLYSVWFYANAIMEPLVKVHLEYVLLTLFIIN